MCIKNVVLHVICEFCARGIRWNKNISIVTVIKKFQKVKWELPKNVQMARTFEMAKLSKGAIVWAKKIGRNHHS